MSPLPKTLYLWLVILAASILLGERLPARTPEKQPTTARERLTGPDFERYLDAERNVRFFFGQSMLTKRDSLPAAAKDYRRLALSLPVPNLTRRTLILEAQLKKPLDPALLARLRTVLTQDKVASAEIEKELALWKALYGTSSALPSDSVARIKAMHLRFLENQALADLAHKQGDRRGAQAAELQRDQKAQRYVMTLTLMGLALFFVGIGGLGLLGLVGVSALKQKWSWLGKVEAPEASPLGWAELVDGFVFYLALYRGVGVGLALLIRTLDLHPPLIPLQLGLQASTGLAAICYLALKARRHGGSLGLLGWSRRDLGLNVLYGIAGYAATLPVSVLLGFIARQLFHNNANTTPNPVLPLLAAPSAFWERGMIFAMAALCAPLFEEFFFRGALLTGLRQRFGSAWGLVFSAVAFAVVHPTQDWIPIFGLGMSFGLMRHLRQSLVPGIVAHFLQNSLAFLMLTTLFTD